MQKPTRDVRRGEDGNSDKGQEILKYNFGGSDLTGRGGVI